MITIREKVELIGDGLHSGRQCRVVIDQTSRKGIFFKNLSNGIEELVSEKTLFGSTLGTNFVFEHDRSAKIMTVEHLLGTLLLMGVTNAIISVDGCEIPIMDGSGKDFADVIKQAGLVRVTEALSENGMNSFEIPIKEDAIQPKRSVTTEFEVRVGDKFVRIKPRDDQMVGVFVKIQFDNECVSAMPQERRFTFSLDDPSLVTSARTFGFKSDIDELLSRGLVLGGCLSNAILIDKLSVINPNGLRFDDEIVTHKMLDLIGDLSPIFYNYCGFDIECFKCGHKINNEFLVEFTKINDGLKTAKVM
ncbi:UDP-3-O-acyl-N-acetylglucosamine deacetylase [Photobacterium damselae]|uniref:UDP-3-O-acyl-N-acetylglucosamine deacetylase n=1 Tax=Photobacterium damselae TaxID=38293 RepID=UPI001F454AC8|nr:UDP-3-O-acyl-N-acetylglucosamine deacetylase [Photobacterium damselae]UKA04660.1 UDP-3-O-acyl-N-acetylglucosamine deacetylase [Photobacterium damselae subsp. damselae]